MNAASSVINSVTNTNKRKVMKKKSLRDTKFLALKGTRELFPSKREGGYKTNLETSCSKMARAVTTV